MSLSPPPPFPDFDFDFDPHLFPNPPTLPASADLFSQAETTDLLGFLDNFNDFAWEDPQPYLSPRAPYSNPHLNTAPEPSTSGRPRRSTRSSTTRAHKQQQRQPQLRRHELSPRCDSATPSNASEGSSQTNEHSTSSTANSAVAPALAAARAKPLLSTPQKRLNHIMSEQKRRNAIRDGYAQLIALLAPAGSTPGLGMPQRGRPKGSGSRSKGQSKGKSGVLFRAVEYIHWLEEGRDAMREEVLRVEAAAGIREH
ncbi:hypothetical protein DFH07DRAFT_410110 [Mycena maculata]|uniref:BHLH domain-containing protein n=1 Tax=Mycena maculata TaxID=230809 RepID=A0AAD7JF71_9AGAR|nr:hypothetical protein DFH07DRAFT_410110 [Mycena maculata]